MKIRLDQYLVQHGLIQSRERAKAMIMSGVVFVNEQKVDKAGEMIKEDAKVEVRGHDIGYVSRGGLKLEKAMQCFPLTPNGKVCMDIGASTGGFTDCMLQNGAVKVYAVDVGYGQLAWKLRTDERVVNMERTNIRSVTPDQLGEPIEFFSVDVSFISLHHIFPVAQAITTPDAMGVCLVKPQFEAGRPRPCHPPRSAPQCDGLCRRQRLRGARAGLQPCQGPGRQHRISDVRSEERRARCAGRQCGKAGRGGQPFHAGSLNLTI